MRPSCKGEQSLTFKRHQRSTVARWEGCQVHTLKIRPKPLADSSSITPMSEINRKVWTWNTKDSLLSLDYFTLKLDYRKPWPIAIFISENSSLLSKKYDFLWEGDSKCVYLYICCTCICVVGVVVFQQRLEQASEHLQSNDADIFCICICKCVVFVYLLHLYLCCCVLAQVRTGERASSEQICGYNLYMYLQMCRSCIFVALVFVLLCFSAG